MTFVMPTPYSSSEFFQQPNKASNTLSIGKELSRVRSSGTEKSFWGENWIEQKIEDQKRKMQPKPDHIKNFPA